MGDDARYLCASPGYCLILLTVYVTNRRKRPCRMERLLTARPWRQAQWRQRDSVWSRGTFVSPRTMTSPLRHKAWTSRPSSRRATGREAGRWDTGLERWRAGCRCAPLKDGWNRLTLAAKAGNGAGRSIRPYDEDLDRTRVWRHSSPPEVTSAAENCTLQNNTNSHNVKHTTESVC